MGDGLVAGLSLENFRGVRGRLDLDFTIEGRPAAVIISGDNGSGKSSIVDGLEFALVGRLLRGTHRTIALNHLGVQGGGEATAALIGDVVSREVESQADPRLGRAPHPMYALSPFIIRRADIIGFFDVHETERQLALANFFRSPRDLEQRLWTTGLRAGELPHETEERFVGAQNSRSANDRSPCP